MIYFGLSLLFSILLCVHAVRTHQAMFWLWIILLFQPLGGLVYIAAVILPAIFGGTTARRLGESARATLDPGRAYREAKDAYDLTPTAQNQMKLAAAAADLGRHDEAERIYGEALQGFHAGDPAILLGRARSLLELGRPADALPLLEEIPPPRSPQAVLALARTYEGVGRLADADAAYRDAAARVPGLEGVARQAAFLARAGRKAEAQDVLTEIDKRASRATAHFRKEARAWRDYAAEAISQV